MALSIPPSGTWNGIDGSWSSFILQVGTNPTALTVFPSTSENADYVIAPQGCPSRDTDNGLCANSRGQLFDFSQSSSWQDIGFYNIPVGNLYGLWNNRGDYGYDTVGLGAQGSGGPSLGRQIVAEIATPDIYFGLFGILPKPVSFVSSSNSHLSYLEVLKDDGRIPSMSWGYTAGAKYQLNGVIASLTLGGYDSSKFEANNVEFPMNPDLSAYLTVGIQHIGLTGADGNAATALQNPIYAHLDSTFPYIWLPKDACDIFETAFNLTYNSTSELYFINPDTIIDPDASVSFVLSPGLDPASPTVRITLPYASFNLTAESPLVEDTALYFPLKRSANQTQNTLGRTFFQEAYITADFERQNFSVSQTTFVPGASLNLVSILSPSNYTVTKPDNSGSSSSAGLIAGVVVAVVVILALGGGFFWWWRRRRARRGPKQVRKPSPPPVELEGDTKHPEELEAQGSGRATPVGEMTEYYKNNETGSYAGSDTAFPSYERTVSPLSAADTLAYHELPGSISDKLGSGTRRTVSPPVGTESTSRPETPVSNRNASPPPNASLRSPFSMPATRGNSTPKTQDPRS